jgi:hypothetical protein
MMGDEGRKERKRGAAGRPERLESELKGNLKKRKEQARRRARDTGKPTSSQDNGKLGS